MSLLKNDAGGRAFLSQQLGEGLPWGKPAVPPTLLIATSNTGKLQEIREIMEELPYQILSLQDLAIPSDAEENGSTFEENALLKALYYAEKSGLISSIYKKNLEIKRFGANTEIFSEMETNCSPHLVLAEDSGIIVDALAGELGVKTRRWGKGEHATDEEWIEYFLEVMRKVPQEKRTASFVCCAALVKDGRTFVFEGQTSGMITPELQAPIQRGLPLSSCFIPIGFDKVYSALPTAEKNRISHRGKAIQQVYEFLMGR